MSEAGETNDSIAAARTDALLPAAALNAVIGFAGAVLVATTMFGTPAEAGMDIFVVAETLILGVGLIACTLYRMHRRRQPATWLRGVSALMLIAGLAWGAMLLWATRAASDPQLLVATAVMLGAMVIGAVSLRYWPAYLAFQVPASAIAAAGWLTSGRSGHFQVGIAAAILCSAVAVAGRRLGREALRAAQLSAENARLSNALRDQAAELGRTDPVTGLANRRAFDERLDLHWAMAARLNRPIALLVIDIDAFDIYRKDFGPAAGDLCLQAVADVLAGSAREATDFAARLDDESFALILPDTDGDAAARVAERIGTTVASFTNEPAADLPAPVTVSVGVAAMTPAAAGTATVLFEQADEAADRAKKAGRNP
ncbi:GGDEF domain-containing protein [Sphingopyxis sp. JAI128]|uniref:GGDEF domain-containing protein n=1 Tax=Sphingopyxis sp. JAI128 TaxID=2723066 RepID=UPI001608F0FC|nr:GGDEF domain-containing protein [Sphingopyxis sp. JAI128]MBB6427781.1 diguanylate cyclase (GGDEF)-like protein [Sphingopyxis sp. JAI128]